MASYITQNLCGPVVGSLVGSDKGDISNRTRCAGAQIKNNVQTLAQDVVVIGGAGAAAYGIGKNAKWTQKLAKFFDKTVNKLLPGKKKNVTLIGESGKPFKTFEIHKSKLAQKLLNMTSKGKVATMIALPVLAALSFINGKHLYKMGQIDQRYTDKAKLEKHEKEIL